MIYKIIEINILPNHPHKDFIVSVAIESSKGFWKSYFKQVPEISEDAFQEIAAAGQKLPEHRALTLFPSCAIDQKLDRMKYED